MIKEEDHKFARLNSFVQFTSLVWIGLGALAFLSAVFFDGTIRLLLLGLAALVMISGAMLFNVTKSRIE